MLKCSNTIEKIIELMSLGFTESEIMTAGYELRDIARAKKLKGELPIEEKDDSNKPL